MENPQESLNEQDIEAEKIPEVSPVRVHKRVVKKYVLKKPVEKVVEVDSLEEVEELTYKQKYEEMMKSKEPKVKRERTPAQVAAFQKAVETRLTNAKKRKEEMTAIAESQKKELEKKILKKAVAIKKREIRSRIALETIESDDEPVEDVLRKAKNLPPKTPRAPVAPSPVWTFV